MGFHRFSLRGSRFRPRRCRIRKLERKKARPQDARTSPPACRKRRCARFRSRSGDRIRAGACPLRKNGLGDGLRSRNQLRRGCAVSVHGRGVLSGQDVDLGYVFHGALLPLRAGRVPRGRKPHEFLCADARRHPVRAESPHPRQSAAFRLG